MYKFLTIFAIPPNYLIYKYMKKIIFQVSEFWGILHLSKKTKGITTLLFLFLLSISTQSFSQTIPSTGTGTTNCGDCTPTGWIDTGGTPDISNRNNAGGQGTVGGGASWASQLPLPPTGDLTWISIRDIGDGTNPTGSEESVGTIMGDLVAGKVYVLSFYTLTAKSNANGSDPANTYYSGEYIEKYSYEIDNLGLQTISTISQDEWGEQKIVFIGQPDGSGNMALTFYPGTDATPGNSPFPGLESLQIVVELNALDELDSDGDGIPDVDDVDDDNDGILDTVEYNGAGDPLGDADGDKLPNYLDPDFGTTTGNGGIPDEFDFDDDGIPNHLDLDSDNDGIPDNIEAQTTAGYIAPSGAVGAGFTDLDGDGLDDNYDPTVSGGTPGTAITPINSDSASVSDNPDYLDLDSDEDNVNDTTEANLFLSGTVGSNGLDNIYDNEDNYTDVNGSFDNTQTDNFPDDGNNASSGGDVNWRDVNVAGALDTDGDGVPNDIDVDDDNDGILDTLEGGGCVIDETFEGPLKADDTVQGHYLSNFYETNSTPNLTPIASPDYVVEGDVFPGNQWFAPIEGGAFLVLNARNDNAIFNSGLSSDNDGVLIKYSSAELSALGVYIGDKITFSFDYAPGHNYDGDGRSSYADSNLKVWYLSTADGSSLPDPSGSPSTISVAPNNTLLPGAWNPISSAGTDVMNPNDWKSFTTEVTYNGGELQIGILAGTGAVITDGNENIFVDQIKICISVDADGDGIPNSLDLDSDNDGIPDNIEAQSTTGYIAPSGSVGAGFTDSDGDGLDDNYDSTVSSGTPGTDITPVNSDGTDNPDFLDSDSDNDGVIDRIEANLSLSGNYGTNGLDANYDNGDGYTDVNGNFDTTQTDNFPDLDTDVSSGGDVDYRDSDSLYQDNDNDGVPDSIDLDDDNDGILDTEEGLVNSCTGYGASLLSESGVVNPNNVIGSPDGVYAEVNTNGNVFTLDFGTEYPAGTQYNIIWKRTTLETGTAIMVLSESANNSSYTTHPNPPSSSQSTTFETDLITSNVAFRYIRITKASPNNTDFFVDAVGIVGSICSIDTDGDGIPNYLDLDSDNDGIPDNIEAQTTAGYIPPSTTFTDVNGDGVDDAYAGGLTPVNTDGTDTADYINTDSDNDGILDSAEAGLSLSGVYGTNGLDNNYDNGDNYSDVNGSFDNSQTNNFPDADGDVLGGGDVDYRDDTYSLDSDGDGIGNETDLDDDNDGILDTVEIGTCNTSDASLNWDAEYIEGTTFNTGEDPINTGDASITTNNIVFKMTRTTNVGSDSNYLINDGITTNSSYNFRQRAAFGANSRHIFDLSSPIYNLSFTIYDVNRDTNSTSTDNVEIILTKQDGTTYALQPGDYTTGATNTYNGTSFIGTVSGSTSNVVINTIPAWIIKIQIVYKNNGTGSVTDSQDIAIGNFTFCTPLDSDGDGVFDYLDLDSDNDGITDVIEAGGTDANLDGIADGTIGSTATTSGIPSSAATGTTPTSTLDGDTLPDYLDIDADNDGIPDNIEAQTSTDYTAPSGVGSGVNGITDVNENGVDDNYENGAVIGVNPVNTDNTDTPDYIDTDADNDGIPDIEENGDTDNVLAGTDIDNDGLDDNFDDNNDSGIAGSTVNDGLGTGNKVTDIATLETAYGDNDSDFNPGNGDLDYRDFPDNDNDGIIDSLDIDDDNDGILDIEEGNGFDPDGDEDGDGIPNYKDTSDANTGDGNTGTDYTDSNSDGIPDVFDFDNDGIPNHFDLDADNDGIPDNIEAQSTTGYVAPTGTDSDNDGLDDAYDTTPDGNIDGSGSIGLTPQNTDSTDNPDFLDLDSDNDGTFDVVESTGVTLPNDGNGTSTGTFGDNGLNDLVETGGTDLGYTDINGSFDDTQTDNFTDTDGDVNLSGGDVDYRDIPGDDSDGDTIANADDLDDDNDGILDLDESNGNDPDGDADGDGIPNYKDTIYTTGGTSDGSITNYTDANSDGTPDVYDNDGDGVPNHLDLDSDNDGIPDVIEAGGTDTDKDGKADGLVGTTVTTNGVPTSAGTGTTPTSTADGDSLPDYLDIDADNDGIPDNIEGQTSADYIAPSGVGSGLDGITDVNENGVDDNYENGTIIGVDPVNTDNSDTPDYIDTDADNDGILDILENGDTDDVLAGTDADNDGLDDSFDDNNDATIQGSTVNDGLGIIPDDGIGVGHKVTDSASLEVAFNDNDDDFPGTGDVDYRDYPDNDNDGVADNIDLDDDNDGILDLAESNGNDPDGDEDGDGIPNYKDTSDANTGDGNTGTDYTDSNSDGIPDVYDNDGDGTPNHMDLDSDNDGIPDVIEAGGTDANQDGKADDDDNNTSNIATNGIPTSAGAGITPINTDSSDGDTLPDYLDIDSDNDGIPDNIEAQSTNEYVAPSGTGAAMLDANNNGVDDNYETGALVGIDPENTDGDASADYVDADSDNDGTLDIVENGDTDNAISGGDSDGDGLYDIFDDNNDSSIQGATVNDGINPPNASNLGDADGDLNTGGDVDYRDIPGDSDGDGVSDDVDLDDDNDGILDVIENGNCSISDKEEIVLLYENDFGTGTTRVTDTNVKNHSYATGTIPDGSYAVVSSLTPNLGHYNRTDANSDLDANIDQFTGPAGGSSNGRFLSINIGSTNSDPEFYRQSLSNLIIGADYRYRLDLAGLCVGCADLPIFRLEVQNTAGTVLESISSASLGVLNDDIWKRVVLNFTATVTDINIVIINEQPNGGAGNDVGVDNIVFGLLQCNPADNDFDNDGIINSLDLDSDNDGCPDALEGNGGFTFTDLDANNRIDNPVNANGIPINPGTIGGNTGQDDVSSVNTSVQSAECDSCNINSSQFVDSDSDSVADACDLDDDNDGILDSVESGIYTPNGDEDGDGIPNYKDTSDAGNNGDSSSTDYTDSNSDGIADVYDTDGDGVPNHLDLDSDNDGIPDVIEAGGTDANRDGRADDNDDNVNNTVTNGIPTSAGVGNTPTSSDGDSLPDYLDIDADNDGIPDNVEGQPTIGYIAPSGTSSTMIDANNNGLDDNYETGGFVGINPENTDGTDNPDYIDTDSDNDGILDIEENGTRPDTLSGIDTDGDGLYDIFEGADNNDGFDVNDEINTPNKASLGDADNDATSTGDLDYRDTTDDGVPMITQVYHLGTEKWIEITNIHTSNSISANVIKIQLYKDKTGDQTGVVPDVTYTVSTPLAPGKSVLFRNSLVSTITNLDITAININDILLTDIGGANDIITLSTQNDATSWENRYDVISGFKDNTSYVRIDETLEPNATYTPSEWVLFLDDRESLGLDPYRFLAAGGAERHPHDPLISEIENANPEANTRLGLHRIDITTTDGSGDWENGYPDRSRFVEIDDDYNHTSARLSARKLRVNTNKKLSVTDNLLVVTNNIFLNGDIRLVNPSKDGSAQLIQTHTSASLVTSGANGKLLVDQNSVVPSKYRYNYIGSPVKSSDVSANYTVADILKDGTNPTSHDGVINANTSTGIAKDINWIGGYDGNFTNSPTDPISLAKYWIYTYAASAGTRASWDQKFSDGEIPNADGFIFKGPGRAQNYTYLGTPKDGNITAVVGKEESYLVANPYASAISVKEFIEDNVNSINGTLYFWEHASETASSEGSSVGHNFAGYIGGYASRTIATGVTAKNAAGTEIDVNMQAETATYNGISQTISNTDVVTLNQSGEFVTFKSIASGVDTLRIRYKADVAKTLRIKENSIIKKEIELPATAAGQFGIENIVMCVVIGSDITFESIMGDDDIHIDYLNLKDDGKITCAPNVGDETIIYTEPKDYIAIGQGFFVQGDNVDGGTIQFNNSQREYIKEGTESVFLKSTKKSDPNNIKNLPVIKLGMNFNSLEDGKKYHRQIAVSFSEYTSFNYDIGYDAEIYDIGSTDIYWKFPSDDIKYVIAGVPAISNDLEVPVEITIGYAGNISLTIDEMKNVNGEVFITDKLTNTSYPIIKNEASFTLEQGTYTDRFVLTFIESNALSVEDENVLSEYVNMYADNENHQLMISKNDEVSINNVELFNILGKKVSRWNIKEQKTSYQLKIKEQLPAGIYVVRINANKGKINKKIVIE